MDNALYVAMSGATQTLQAQAVNNNNIANASTVGFRAELAASSSVAVQGPGQPTRVNTVLGSNGWDATQGSVMSTGNPLDVALTGNSWLAVQATDGSEAYTRAGDLHVTALGQLMTSSGQPVMGDNGPVSVPPSTSVSIGTDGTISIVPMGSQPNTSSTVGRLKVVQAQPSQLKRGTDGLMRAQTGVKLQPASGQVVVSGALESSNVNLADAMANMIQLSRQFEMQVKAIKATEDNATSSSSLVRMNS
jgi:flagellar basal-body rod protein FlgF